MDYIQIININLTIRYQWQTNYNIDLQNKRKPTTPSNIISKNKYIFKVVNRHNTKNNIKLKFE